MESIPPAYFVFIYMLMALPMIFAILGAVLLIIIARLYFTNRRKTALKISKVAGIVIPILIAFAWLTQSSLGI